MKVYNGLTEQKERFSIVKTDNIDIILAAMLVDKTNSMDRALFTDNRPCKNDEWSTIAAWRKPVIKRGVLYFRHNYELIRVNGFRLWTICGGKTVLCGLYSDVDRKIQMLQYIDRISKGPIEIKEKEVNNVL